MARVWSTSKNRAQPDRWPVEWLIGRRIGFPGAVFGTDHECATKSRSGARLLHAGHRREDRLPPLRLRRVRVGRLRQEAY